MQLQHLSCSKSRHYLPFRGDSKLCPKIWSRGGRITLAPIAQVQTYWESPLQAFEDTLTHEQKVTEMINNLYALADSEKDYATQSMLRWFIDEQVEEEETAQEIIKNLRLIKDNGFGLFMLDKELGARTYTPVTTTNKD